MGRLNTVFKTTIPLTQNKKHGKNYAFCRVFALHSPLGV